MERLDPISIAALDGPDIRYGGFLYRLKQTHNSPCVFADAASLLTALAVGRRFELLVVPVQQDVAQMEQLTLVCKALGMPMLVVTLPGHADMDEAGSELLMLSSDVDLVCTDGSDTEIDWRIRALVRRTQASAYQSYRQPDLVVGHYRFVEDERAVFCRERRIILQPRQFALARALFLNVNKVLSRDWLLLSLWGITSPQEGARSLDVCVTNVRKKLDLCYASGFTLRSVYRLGYMLSSHQESTSEQRRPASSVDFKNDHFGAPDRHKAAPPSQGVGL